MQPVTFIQVYRGIYKKYFNIKRQTSIRTMEYDKVIADPIHGMMTFEPYLMKIINHPHFQRLRHIKQLQGVEHVYPGGVHSRFSHCLGVCYLAGIVLDKLEKKTKNTDYEITDLDRKCVTISALCHNIGHGPFSYLYERLSREIDSDPFEHVARSVEITQSIIDDDSLKLFEDKTERTDAKTIIENMLKGKKVEEMTAKEQKKAFLYQIVKNNDNGVDVNRWDFISRDSHACGFMSNFDSNRAVSGLRVVSYKKEGIDANVLAFPFKDEIHLYNMFHLRFTLYSKVYYHTVVKCVEEMITDVFKLVDEIKILNTKENSISTKECRSHGAIENFCLMDDKLLYLIYHADDTSFKKPEKLKHAHAIAIMDRIHNRDFYFCIYKKQLDSSEKVGRLLEEINKRSETDNSIRGRFRFNIAEVNYGNGNKNPIKNVYFYSKGGDSVIEYKQPVNSPMVPQCFEEITLRVICTIRKKDWDSSGSEDELKTQIDSFFENVFNQQ
ncbi:hypothetical protein KUTeg_015089 [Tegillarca granosa]|uniref:HD domain-containing protein n=1 Tax=Tegillarca granosa TaxID=220873 RepID=A0ABQ9EUC1_TEGGR|nr:hypothetical protein KUTeg_015089 [Tegillarca granosa]